MKLKLLAKLLFLPLTLFTVGCGIVVEDPDDQNDNNPTEVIVPSSASVQSSQDDFSIKWQKNTEGYGQLEITSNVSIAIPLASITSGKREVVLSCTYASPDIFDSSGSRLKHYNCSVENADIVGTFSIVLPAEQELLIIERKGKDTSNEFEVLSEFMINASHGSTPPVLASSASVQTSQDYFSIKWQKNT